MPMWKIAPVSDSPGVRLRDWRILELPNGNRHFAGADATDGTGRVSSLIVEFDMEKKVGRTRSGRVYELLGKTGWSDNAEYVWNQWSRINSVTDFVDVSPTLMT